MQNISQYINEARSSGPVEIEYTPKNREELIDAIREVAKVQSDRKILDFNNIDVKSVDNLRWAFFDALKDMSELLKKDFLCDKWDVSNVVSFGYTFAKCNGFTGKGLEKWKVSSKCKEMDGMFRKTAIKKIDMTRWNMSEVKNISEMFWHAKEVQSIKFPDVPMPNHIDMTETFLYCESLEYLKLPRKRMETYATYEAFANCGTNNNRLVIDNLDSLTLRRRDGKNLNTLYENTFRECGIEPKILKEFIENQVLSAKDIKFLGIDTKRF